MSPEPYATITRLLLALMVRRIREEHAASVAADLLLDLGFDHCPVCLANRRREALGGTP